MITFTASHAGKHFGEVRERALSEPVGIERHGRVNVVVLSASEYERLKALDRRRSLAASEIPDELAEQIERSEMDARHDILDSPIEDKEK
jgi:PHD/YefM family antitoxin component YafN of YafNO toxin-antitoxin module